MTLRPLALLGSFLALVPAAGAATTVGRQADGSVLLPDGQRIRPAGLQVEMRGSPTGVAVAPDGRTAVVHLGGDGGDALYVVSIPDGRILQAYDTVHAASFDGVAYSPDGRHLFASAASGSVAIVDVRDDGTLGDARAVDIPKDDTKICCGPYPGGLAPSADGRTLYVALSVNNTLGVIDVASATLTSQIPVGNAPHSVVVAGDRAFVSNEGGRPAQPGDFTARSGGTEIVADPFTAEAITGTVSVVDLAAGKQTATIPVGVHPTAMALDGDHLYVAGTNADTVSDIDLGRLEVVRTIPVSPFDGAPHGAMPDGLAVLPQHRLAVTLGRDNALEIIDITRSPAVAKGLLPVGWYPAGVAYDAAAKRLLVANNQGVGSLADADAGAHARAVGGEIGSLSILAMPDGKALRVGARTVSDLNGWTPAKPPPPAAAGDPIPARLGDPSPIKHVVYIIRENRTYDQVLGDIGRGDSDPSLVNYGQKVTPNAHAMATQFPLLDNFYVSGRRSNDGHQWAVAAQNADYFQKSNANNERSELNAPSSGFDALLYTPSGFIWENALRHGKTFDDYGEYTKEDVAPPAYSDIPSLESHVAPEFPGFQLEYPDQLRANVFARHMAAYEAAGSMPDLILLTLPCDHTGGSNPMYDTPEAQVADNDAATGQIVDAISHSNFWPSTAIFVAEDDAQGGADHVDGHRSLALVVSPYARRGAVDSTFATQVSIVRTIEQILGLPPMNHLDAATPPMYSAFTSTPDLTPYDAIAPQVATDVPNPPIAALTGIRREWAVAMTHQDFRHIDAPNQQMLKRNLWYAAKGWDVPFPGDGRVLHPWEVRGGDEDDD